MDRRLEVLDMIIKDAEEDVNYYEGKPFTGRNVSEHLGKHAASIQALANILKTIIPND